MPATRLLLVDDSAIIRRDLTEVLKREPGLEVVGAASSGRVALMKIPLLKPDVVVLDIEMPEKDELETVAAMRHAWPKVPVIILNVATARGLASTVDAPTLGASGHVMKPEAIVPSADALATLAVEIVSRIEQCCPGFSRVEQAARTATGPSGYAARRRVDVVAIGVSTGGPQALMEMMPVFGADFPVPILIVQHMPPVFTKLLAERLRDRASIPVAEGMLYQTLSPG